MGVAGPAMSLSDRYVRESVSSSGPMKAPRGGRGRAGSWLVLVAAVLVAAIDGSTSATGANDDGAGGRGWSRPSVLAECALGVGPRVAFPSDSPRTATGPGAIVWARGRGDCRGSDQNRAQSGLAVAALGSGDRTVAMSDISLPEPAAGLGAVGGSLGRISVAAPSRSPDGGAGDVTAVLQGRSTHLLGAPILLAGASVPPALARGYLGDVAIATVVGGPAIAVRTDRYFRSGFAPARLVPIATGRVTALTATMDYRSDVLIAWQQNGAIYAHMLRASGRSDQTQRIGPSNPYPQLQAVVSDNNHGMVAWSDTEVRRGSLPTTRVRMNPSAIGVRFGAPQLVTAFSDPQALGRSPGSLQLVRLSSENVLLAWTAAQHGHYVVRAAPALFAPSGPSVRVSGAQSGAVLAGLAPGRDREAVALWRGAGGPNGLGADPGRGELWTARVFIGRHDRPESEAPESLPTGAVVADPALAVDPATDHAVAAWLTPGASDRVEYAVNRDGGGYRGGPPAASVSPSAHQTDWLAVALAAAGVAAAALIGLALLRRRRAR